MECDLLMIKIEKVINKKDLKAFIAFPSSLYPDDPNWIPPLFIERSEHLSAKNPGTDHIIWQAWVAKKAGQIVERIPRKSIPCTVSVTVKIPVISA